MDKSFIMKLDNNTELLGKERPSGPMQTHQVAFPEIRTVATRREVAVELIAQHLEAYKDREFYVAPDNYGVEVSVTYAAGKFHSMILKGDGVSGERVIDEIAKMLVPAEAKNKGQVVLHCLLTIQDLMRFRGGTPKMEVPMIIKGALREGFLPYEEKKLICRPYSLFVDGKRCDIYKLWATIAGSLLIPGLYMEYSYETLKTNLHQDLIQDYEDYLVPVRGFLVEDANPEDETAFPATRFLFDDSIVDATP
jgi:hypothetical protein